MIPSQESPIPDSKEEKEKKRCGGVTLSFVVNTGSFFYGEPEVLGPHFVL